MSQASPNPIAADFRSDACSLPTPAMLQAMAQAEVGDDDFGEDPTVNRLERDVAELLGKPAGLFVQSGTMGNLVALMAHVQPGDEILVSPHFHLFDHEGEAVQRVVGCRFRFLADRVEGCRVYLTKEDDTGRARLLSLENTVNRLGGTVIPPCHLADLSAWVRGRGLAVHLDGARIFNAACFLGVPPATLAEPVDSVMVTFTKALAAPAGAALAGSSEFICRARRFRWMLGGNWKQGGVIAAACLVGLRTMLDQIPLDHATARQLAESLNAIPGVSVNLDRVVTNLIYMSLEDPCLNPAAVEELLAGHGIRIGRFKNRVSRLCIYKDIDRPAVELLLDGMREAVRKA